MNFNLFISERKNMNLKLIEGYEAWMNEQPEITPEMEAKYNELLRKLERDGVRNHFATPVDKAPN